MKKEKLKEKAVQLSEQGLSLGKIAQQLGVGKTTVHTWINYQNGERTEKNVPDVLENEVSKINEFKNELQNEFGVENDVQLLVALKKAEMEHTLQMEKIELERERMQNDQILRQKSIQSDKTEHLATQLEKLKSEIERERQKSEQLTFVIEKLEQNNSLLSTRLDNINAENTILKIDEKLANGFLEQVNNYLELDEIPVTQEDVETVLEEEEQTIKQIKKWIKNNNRKKSDYLELDTLKKIQSSLYEMANEFGENGEEELIFGLDPAFKRELEKWRD